MKKRLSVLLSLALLAGLVSPSIPSATQSGGLTVKDSLDRTVVSLKPDIIFASPFERQIVEAIQRKTRIPVVALASLGDAVYKKFYGLDDGFAKLSAILRCDEWAHD